MATESRYAINESKILNPNNFRDKDYRGWAVILNRDRIAIRKKINEDNPRKVASAVSSGIMAIRNMRVLLERSHQFNPWEPIARQSKIGRDMISAFWNLEAEINAGLRLMKTHGITFDKAGIYFVGSETICNKGKFEGW